MTNLKNTRPWTLQQRAEHAVLNCGVLIAVDGSRDVLVNSVKRALQDHARAALRRARRRK